MPKILSLLVQSVNYFIPCMKDAINSIFFLIAIAFSILFYSSSSSAENFIELKYGHLAGSNNTSDDLITPTFGWKGKKWRGHILKDFSFDDDSTRERIEIEASYAHEGLKGEDGSDGKGLTLFNEITYDVDKKSWSAELTPAWFMLGCSLCRAISVN